MASARKDPQLDARHQAILKKMMQNPESKTCADCKHASPRWASTNLGVFLCIACSGIHRKLGTHISKVRSITLDTWTPSQIEHFQVLGNAVSAAHYEASLPPNFLRPSPSDSYAMERFIRDKYERQIYIAGGPAAGGGGGSVPVPHPLSLAIPAGLGQRPTNYAAPYAPPQQQRGGYDDYAPGVASPNVHSYSSQFRNSSPRFRHSGGTAARHSYHAGQSGISYQTSAVVSAITDMGFPQYMAEEAAAKHGSDLQKAVDWVLKQKSTRLYSAPSPRHAQPVQPSRPVPKAQPVQDLLDFSSDVPALANTAASKPVPKTFGLESLMGGTLSPQPAQLAQPAKASPTGAADENFADFGAFERALPASSAPVQPASKPVQASQPKPSIGTSGYLNATLAGLYAKKPANIPPVTASKQPMSNQSNFPRMVTLGQSGLHIATKSPIGQAGINPTPTVAVPHTPGLSVGQAGTATYNYPSPPPPPVPTQADMFSNSVSAPPPPSPSPPVLEAVSSASPKDTKEPSKSPAQDTAAVEDADPFAFLAKQALSSATSKKKEVKKPIADKASQNTAPGASLPVASTTSGLTFEDLMG